MGMQSLVSVIIPVYNTDCYLQRCLDSVCGQTYRNLEIIVVDDGSKDNSSMIIDSYAQKDERVIAVHQRNKGQAAARNRAFLISRGAFIVYIDSDDYISDNYIELLLRFAIAEEGDIVQCQMKKVAGESPTKKADIITQKNIRTYTAEEALEEFCYQRNFYAGPWCKIIRRELLDDIFFPENTGYEDMAVIFRLLGKAKKIVLLPQVMYYYRQHSESTMHNKFSAKKIDRIIIADQLKKYIETYYPQNIQAMKSRYLLAQMQLIMDLPFDEKYNDLRKCIKSNICMVRKDVIQDKKAKKGIRIMACVSYGGIYLLMVLGRIYKVIFN